MKVLLDLLEVYRIGNTFSIIHHQQCFCPQKHWHQLQIESLREIRCSYNRRDPRSKQWQEHDQSVTRQELMHHGRFIIPPLHFFLGGKQPHSLLVELSNKINHNDLGKEAGQPLILKHLCRARTLADPVTGIVSDTHYMRDAKGLQSSFKCSRQVVCVLISLNKKPKGSKKLNKYFTDHLDSDFHQCNTPVGTEWT